NTQPSYSNIKSTEVSDNDSYGNEEINKRPDKIENRSEKKAT
ncbi:115_t:CDS:1, partial [Racocetra persica]